MGTIVVGYVPKPEGDAARVLSGLGVSHEEIRRGISDPPATDE